MLVVLLVPHPAGADLTAFVGATRSPPTRPAVGVALNMSLFIVGFEFEYSDTREDAADGTPGLRTGMFNLLLQTPNLGGVRVYGTAGGGLYQERLGGDRDINAGSNVGGGLVIPLVGPIGARLDYRVFMLRGGARGGNPQRLYLGANLGF